MSTSASVSARLHTATEASIACRSSPLLYLAKTLMLLVNVDGGTSAASAYRWYQRPGGRLELPDVQEAAVGGLVDISCVRTFRMPLPFVTCVMPFRYMM